MLIGMNSTIAAVLALACASPAFAATSASAAPSLRVSTAGVNFTDSAAVSTFYVQLKRAAASVCDTNSANSRIAQADQRCAHAVLAEAVSIVNQPMLTALHRTS